MTGKEYYWDRISELWQNKGPQELWRLHSNAVNTALLESWLPSDRVEYLLKTDLFDEAFSDGLYPTLTSRAKIVVGMDVSILTLNAAVSRHSDLQATGADVRHLPFAEGSFDTIVSNSTLDHFESAHEIIASLGELHRVLRTGGQLILTLDNLANPLIALRNFLPFRPLNRLGILPYFVGSTFGPRRLHRALHQLGFKITQVSTVMHCPRLFAVAMARMLEKHTGRESQKRFLHFLMAFERLAHLPTRFLTGYFVAVRAIKG